MTKQLTDVWKLETGEQEQVCDMLNAIYEQAIKGGVRAKIKWA